MGCGPAEIVHFCGEAKDDSPKLFLAKVLNTKTNKTTEYYETGLSIGHGMCGGAFLFENDVTYQVQFGIMDASGNVTEKLTDPISFTGPIKNEKSEDNCDCDNSTELTIFIIVGSGLFILISLLIFWIRRKKKEKVQSL